MFRFILYAALPLFTPNPVLLDLFLTSSIQSIFHPAAYKRAIKELVVCNHRMWPKASREQLSTCQPLILYDKLRSSTKPPTHTHTPSDEANRKGRGSKSFPCQTVTCLNQSKTSRAGCSHPEVRPLLCLLGSCRHVGATWKYLRTCSL